MYMNAINSGITEERADTSLAILAQPSLPPLCMAMLAGLVPDPRPTTLRLRLGDTDAGVIDLIPDQYAVGLLASGEITKGQNTFGRWTDHQQWCSILWLQQ